MNLQSRVERLEQRGESETGLLVIVGEATDEQQAMLDAGRVKVVVQMPSNGRDGHDRHQSKT